MFELPEIYKNKKGGAHSRTSSGTMIEIKKAVQYTVTYTVNHQPGRCGPLRQY